MDNINSLIEQKSFTRIFSLTKHLHSMLGWKCSFARASCLSVACYSYKNLTITQIAPCLHPSIMAAFRVKNYLARNNQGLLPSFYLDPAIRKIPCSWSPVHLPNHHLNQTIGWHHLQGSNRRHLHPL